MVLFPLLPKAQSPTKARTNRTIISSLEMGAATYNTKVVEVAALFGLKDHNEGSTLEVGYVFKQILAKNIGHHRGYHGIRVAIETPLVVPFGVYGTYDVIKGERWLYDDIAGNGLKVHSKVHGEGTLGMFFAPERSVLKFYAGLEPRHYDPLNVAKGLTPHKSLSINLKVKYTFDL